MEFLPCFHSSWVLLTLDCATYYTASPGPLFPRFPREGINPMNGSVLCLLSNSFPNYHQMSIDAALPPVKKNEIPRSMDTWCLHHTSFAPFGGCAYSRHLGDSSQLLSRIKCLIAMLGLDSSKENRNAFRARERLWSLCSVWFILHGSYKMITQMIANDSDDNYKTQNEWRAYKIS